MLRRTQKNTMLIKKGVYEETLEYWSKTQYKSMGAVSKISTLVDP